MYVLLFDTPDKSAPSHGLQRAGGILLPNWWLDPGPEDLVVRCREWSPRTHVASSPCRCVRLRAHLQAEAASATLATQVATAACDAKEASTTVEAATEESLRVRIAKKQQRKAVKAMAGQTAPRTRKTRTRRIDIFNSEQIHPDLFHVFNRYCRKDNGKGKVKGKASCG